MASPLARYTSSPFQGGPAGATSAEIYDQLSDSRDFFKKVGVQKEQEAQRIADNQAIADLMQIGGTQEELQNARSAYFKRISADPNVDTNAAMDAFDARLKEANVRANDLSIRSERDTKSGQYVAESNAEIAQKLAAARSGNATAAINEDNLTQVVKSREEQALFDADLETGEEYLFQGQQAMRRQATEEVMRDPQFRGKPSHVIEEQIDALSQTLWEDEMSEGRFKDWIDGVGLDPEIYDSTSFGANENALQLAAREVATERAKNATAEQTAQYDLETQAIDGANIFGVDSTGEVQVMSAARQKLGSVKNFEDTISKGKGWDWVGPDGRRKRLNPSRWRDQDGAKIAVDSLIGTVKDKTTILNMLASVTNEDGTLDLKALDELHQYTQADINAKRKNMRRRRSGIDAYVPPVQPPTWWMDYRAANPGKFSGDSSTKTYSNATISEKIAAGTADTDAIAALDISEEEKQAAIAQNTAAFGEKLQTAVDEIDALSSELRNDPKAEKVLKKMRSIFDTGTWTRKDPNFSSRNITTTYDQEELRKKLKDFDAYMKRVAIGEEKKRKSRSKKTSKLTERDALQSYFDSKS